jgi:hypothetical protein
MRSETSIQGVADSRMCEFCQIFGQFLLFLVASWRWPVAHTLDSRNGQPQFLLISGLARLRWVTLFLCLKFPGMHRGALAGFSA